MRYCEVSSVYSEAKKYTRTLFHEELALKLLPYKANRQVLIEELQSAYGGIGMRIPVVLA